MIEIFLCPGIIIELISSRLYFKCCVEMLNFIPRCFPTQQSRSWLIGVWSWESAPFIFSANRNVELCLIPNRCMIAINVWEPVFDVFKKKTFSSPWHVLARNQSPAAILSGFPFGLDSRFPESGRPGSISGVSDWLMTDQTIRKPHSSSSVVPWIHIIILDLISFPWLNI